MTHVHLTLRIAGFISCVAPSALTALRFPLRVPFEKFLETRIVVTDETHIQRKHSGAEKWLRILRR